MRVFVLTTGRSGSQTLAMACSHISNFTSAHEGRGADLVDRCLYPDNHIEIDNRLSWFLGTVERLYGDDPLYVVLTRDPEEVARSYAPRALTAPASIVRAFGRGVILREEPFEDNTDWLQISRLCVATMNDNINAFVKNKSNVLRIDLSNLESGFAEMWDRIGATGDYDASLRELRQRHNRTQIGWRKKLRHPFASLGRALSLSEAG